jgi:hypothetical protein
MHASLAYTGGETDRERERGVASNPNPLLTFSPAVASQQAAAGSQVTHDVTAPGGPLEGRDKATLLRAALEEWDGARSSTAGPRERAFFSALRAVLAECHRASPLQVGRGKRCSCVTPHVVSMCVSVFTQLSRSYNTESVCPLQEEPQALNRLRAGGGVQMRQQKEDAAWAWFQKSRPPPRQPGGEHQAAAQDAFQRVRRLQSDSARCVCRPLPPTRSALPHVERVWSCLEAGPCLLSHRACSLSPAQVAVCGGVLSEPPGSTGAPSARG